MLNTHEITNAVDKALPTIVEQAERDRQDAAEARAKESAARRRKQDAELDKIRARLRDVSDAINSEPGLRDGIKALTVRFAEQAGESAELEIANRIGKLLGEPVNQSRKARIESLEAQNKTIEQTTIPAQVKRLRDLQARLPELLVERAKLRRQLEASLPVYV
jgi:archaellum component FlaC